MPRLHGVITDRLLKLFKPGDTAWNPGRPPSPTKPKPLPKGVEGHKLGGRRKK